MKNNENIKERRWNFLNGDDEKNGDDQKEKTIVRMEK